MMPLCAVGEVCALRESCWLVLNVSLPHPRLPPSRQDRTGEEVHELPVEPKPRCISAFHNQNPCVRLQIYPVDVERNVLAKKRSHTG